ncbi:MAG: periplasmic binding protein [uncultured archaeon A07HB70]|nr:MAG: periplasmic binding protein [uncultured archaeon A07HB70]
MVNQTNPDVVLVANIISNAAVGEIRNETPDDVAVYRFRQANSVEFIYQKTRLTGKLVDECDAADARTAELRAQVDTVRRATADVESKRVLYTFSDGFTATENYYITDVIETAGGESIGAAYGDKFDPGTYGYAGQFFGFFPDRRSELAAENPEWIVRPTGTATIASEFSSSAAVQQNQLVRVNVDYMNQPAPRVVIAMTQIVRALYPERYRQARLGLLAEEVDSNTGGTWEVPYRDADPLDGTVEGDTAYLRVKNGDPPRTQFPVPEAFDTNSTVRLTEVAVDTQEPNPIFTVTVQNATATAPSLPGDATMLAAYETDTEDLHMFATNATYTLSVPLESVPGDPSALAVYRRSGDGWAPLETAVRVNETTQTANVTASADRLTAFAVGAAVGDARSTVEAAPEPMSAYAAPDPVPADSTADTPASAADPAAPSVEATPGDASAAPGAVGTPVVALTALLAAALVVGRRR